MPGVLDHYLGRTGYRSQQTDEAEPRGRPDNLFEPLDGDGGDHGAHGAFDERARAGSAELWAVTHRWAAAGAGIAGLGAAGAAAAALTRRGRDTSHARNGKRGEHD
jgi:hypothetical protein